MKRFLTLLLALAMLFALCACGGSDAPAAGGREENPETDEAMELYEKYRDILYALEEKNYSYATQKIAELAWEEEPKEEKAPIADLFNGTWYLGGIGDKQNPPETITLSADGKVTVGGDTLTWLENHSGDDYMSGWLLKDGVYTYAMRLQNDKEYVLPLVELCTVEKDGSNYFSDDYYGTYNSLPMAGLLMDSWSNLNEKDETMPSNFYVDRQYVRMNNNEIVWTVEESTDSKITIQIGDTHTLTAEKRDGRSFATLTEKATGNEAYYYEYESGYDRSWKEFIYPRAIQYLNDCLDDVQKNYTPGFSSYLKEESKSFSGNEAWKELYNIFAALGDYRDSAEYLARFTVLKDKYTHAERVRVDNMGNTSTNKTYEEFTYNALDQMVKGSSADLTANYGGYSNTNLYFFYDANGRLEKVQEGTGNSVSTVITLTYDAQGRVTGGDYKSNSQSHQLSYTYDAQGRLAENIVWNGSDRYKYTYTYDAAGRLTERVCWYGWNEPDYQRERYTVKYTYDASGNCTGFTQVNEYYDDWNKKFTLQETITMTYTNDAQGRPVSAVRTETNRNGESSYKSQTITYHYGDLYFFN